METGIEEDRVRAGNNKIEKTRKLLETVRHLDLTRVLVAPQIQKSASESHNGIPAALTLLDTGKDDLCVVAFEGQNSGGR